MKIGEASFASGVSAKMIRYYESIGLVAKAKRSTQGYRAYSEADIHTLRFIRRCRELGFDMAEISELLRLWQERGRRSSVVKRLAAGHVRTLEEKIEALQGVVRTLSHLMHECHGDDRPECPILDDLGQGPRLPVSSRRGPSRSGTSPKARSFVARAAKAHPVKEP
jgi:MerR family transcriptional regulator, copper efflux regulator